MKPRPTRDQYRWFVEIPTRWMDNDVYGHVNNVVYYSYFDTAVNRFLIDRGLLDVQRSEIIGYAVESCCTYLSPVAFPDQLQAGVRVPKIGRSSVRYEVGIFAGGSEEAAAHGYFVHVYVDRGSQRPVAALPESMRSALAELAPSDSTGPEG